MDGGSVLTLTIVCDCSRVHGVGRNRWLVATVQRGLLACANFRWEVGSLSLDHIKQVHLAEYYGTH